MDDSHIAPISEMEESTVIKEFGSISNNLNANNDEVMDDLHATDDIPQITEKITQIPRAENTTLPRMTVQEAGNGPDIPGQNMRRDIRIPDPILILNQWMKLTHPWKTKSRVREQ